MNRSRLPRFTTAVATAFIAAYFLSFTTGSLRAEFTYDDLMNCYRGWFRPLPELLADNLFFFRYSPTFRPFGALVYKVFFGPYGFDLYPLRVLLLIVLASNVWLTCRLCRALTQSTELGLFAALVFCYHMKFWPLYYTTGTLYDIFCFTFYVSALLVYIEIRRHGKRLTRLNLLTLCALYILALDSKEAAVTLPAILALYEILWHPPAPARSELVDWFTQRMAPVWLIAAITIAYLGGRIFSPELGISSTGGYRITLSVGEYLTKAAFYLGELFYAPDWFDASKAAMTVLLLLLIAAISRSRSFLFGGLLFLLGILPLAFIPVRVLSAVYLPLAGLSICAAVLLGFVCSALRRLSSRELWQSSAFVLVFLAAALSLIRVHPGTEHIYAALGAEYTRIRETRERLIQLHPTMPEHSRILILNTPFPQYSPGYHTLFLIRLLYRDESLVVDELARLKENRQTPALTEYDVIVSYEQGQLVDVDPHTLQFQPTEP
ncbi:MAG: hypothetical protein WD733_00165 [Bryobacterales bacterium]